MDFRYRAATPALSPFSIRRSACRLMAKEAESSYNRYIRTKSGDYFKVKKEAAIQRRIAGYYEKGGNGKKADSLRKDAEKREKNSKKGIREEN